MRVVAVQHMKMDFPHAGTRAEAAAAFGRAFPGARVLQVGRHLVALHCADCRKVVFEDEAGASDCVRRGSLCPACSGRRVVRPLDFQI